MNLEFGKGQRTSTAFQSVQTRHKCRYRDTTRARNYFKPAWRNAVGALLIFLDLLKGQLESVAELRLRKARLLSINANAFADLNINWVWHPAAKRFLTFWHS